MKWTQHQTTSRSDGAFFCNPCDEFYLADPSSPIHKPEFYCPINCDTQQTIWLERLWNTTENGLCICEDCLRNRSTGDLEWDADKWLTNEIHKFLTSGKRCCLFRDCGTDDGEIVSHCYKQFNFARNWKAKIAPLLKEPDVDSALNLGMTLLSPQYKSGDPPWFFGRGPINGQRARKGCLSWYQPWGRCYWIAPFAYALAKHLFPDLRWGILAGDLHSIVIGYSDCWRSPEMVFDILLHRKMSADDSINHVRRNARFFRCLKGYAYWLFDESQVGDRSASTILAPFFDEHNTSDKLAM